MMVVLGYVMAELPTTLDGKLAGPTANQARKNSSNEVEQEDSPMALIFESEPEPKLYLTQGSLNLQGSIYGLRFSSEPKPDPERSLRIELERLLALEPRPEPEPTHYHSSVRAELCLRAITRN
ncbi:hypothetical protein V496_00603 [Pseudogymnoascus sp. VKM F-4515 (FW-2607)]|nr:hypothetical protein V496_00603 [Pseudogymnoascus sp. VKM F-4515 (FW-2607)]